MIHKYQLNGFNIVLDVNSGAVHVVDDLFYQMLDYLTPPLPEKCPEAVFQAFPEHSREELEELYGEIYDLFIHGQLYSVDDYDQFANRMTSSPVKAMCLHIAHDCNLRCKYCFASTGDFGEGRKLMPLEVGKKAIDYLIYHSRAVTIWKLTFSAENL